MLVHLFSIFRYQNAEYIKATAIQTITPLNLMVFNGFNSLSFEEKKNQINLHRVFMQKSRLYFLDLLLARRVQTFHFCLEKNDN